MMLLVKAYPADGRAPVASWHTIFEAQEQKLVYGRTNFVATLERTGPPSAPLITRSPASRRVPYGTRVEFVVEASSDTPLAYQWTKDSQPLSGQTSARLLLSHSAPSDAGEYAVLVSNSAGSNLSSSAMLSVAPPLTITVGRAGGVLSVAVPTFEGLDYFIESTHQLEASRWTTTSTLPGNGQTQFFTPILLDRAAFIRVREQERKIE
jgi:hypothetical protein